MEHVGKLVLFRDIVDQGSFTRAAAKWGLSHSTVSKHIRTLESALGVQLLHRTSRSMNLTEHGQLVYGYSRDVGASVEQLMLHLDEVRDEVRGQLRISCLRHVGRHLVQPAIARLMTRHPRIRVTLVLDDGPLAFHRDGFDLAIRVGRGAEGSLTARKLLDNPVCMVASPGLLERRGSPEHPRQLASYPTVAYVAGPLQITAWTYIDQGEYRTVQVDPGLCVDDGNGLLDAVRAGLGIGYLSAFAVREDLDRGTLVRVLPRFELPAYDPIYMLYAGSKYASPKLEALKHALVEVARTLD
ncbi:MAG: LysR family transcriptional regulator [Myxococcota bacterium]